MNRLERFAYNSGTLPKKESVSPCMEFMNLHNDVTMPEH
jgi:hypothetical protein